jgi:hypothetical protein
MESDNKIYNDNIKPLEEMFCNIYLHDSKEISDKFNEYFFNIQEYFSKKYLKEGGNLKKYRKSKKGGGIKDIIIKYLKNPNFTPFTI